jgi:hypothetical protein
LVLLNGAEEEGEGITSWVLFSLIFAVLPLDLSNLFHSDVLPPDGDDVYLNM